MPTRQGEGSRASGEAAVPAAAAGAHTLPVAASPSLGGLAQHQQLPQNPMQFQMASLGLTMQSPLLSLPSFPSCGLGGLPPPPPFISLPFAHQHEAGAPGFGAAPLPQIQLQSFHLPMAGAAAGLGSLPLGWAVAGGDSGAAAAVGTGAAASQAAPASSGMRQAPSSRQQQGHQPGGAQQEASAPQIMSNTDVGGSTEGTQAWGGGGGGAPPDGGGNRSGSGRAGEGAESGAAESRLKAPQAGSRRAHPSEPRKSRFKGVVWDRQGCKWRARLHTDKTRHIGYFEREEDAGRAWDLAALNYWGEAPEALSRLNFQSSLALFRQQQQQKEAAAAAAAAAPASAAAPSAVVPVAEPQYKGVARLEEGRYRATVRQGPTPLVVGEFATAEDAARAYDRESLRLKGRGAITNFPLSDYLAADGPGMPSPVAAPRAGSTDRLSGHAASSDPLGGGGAARPPGQQAGWQRQGSAGPSGATSGACCGASSLLHTPAVAGLPSKRRRLGDAGNRPTLDAAGQGPQQHAAAAGQQAAAQAAQGAAAPGGAHVLPAVHSPPEAAGGSHLDESAGFAGVRRLGGVADNQFQAFLTLDLGRFATAEAAARAHDAAALLAAGFLAPLNAALPDALAAAPAAQHALRGVAQRGAAWIALLDLGGSPYELGPFGTALEAARAHDRYSLLLLGTRAQTNFPPWEYLASAGECQALAAAVAQVQAQQAQQAQQGTPQGTRRCTPPSAGRLDQGAAATAAAQLMVSPDQGRHSTLPSARDPAQHAAQYHHQQQQYQQQQVAELPPFPPAGVPGLSGQNVPKQAQQLQQAQRMQQAQQLLDCQAGQQQQTLGWLPHGSGLAQQLVAGQPGAATHLGFAAAQAAAPPPGGAACADALWQTASLPGGSSAALAGPADPLSGSAQP